MKIFVMLFAVLLLPFSVFGQHTVALSAQPSATTGVSTYNVYRAPCTTVTGGICTAGEGVYAKIGSATIGATITYTDSTVKGGSNYSFYFTAACPVAGCGTDASGNLIAGESGPSNKIGAVIPATLPLPPGNLSITNVSRNSTGANAILSAQWVDSPGVKTTYTFFGNGNILQTGSLSNATGSYSAVWSGKIKPGSAVTFEVCDSNGACSSKLI
jgi:hypothetical protein